MKATQMQPSDFQVETAPEIVTDGGGTLVCAPAALVTDTQIASSPELPSQSEATPDEIERASEVFDAALADRSQTTSFPDQTIEGLLAHMGPRRKVLLGILDFCRTPQSVDDIESRVSELQARNASVYSAAAMVAMLEKTGAIERRGTEGERVNAEATAPKVELVDGVECLVPARPAALLWRTTASGTRALEADDPIARFRELVVDDEAYLPVYARILELCARDGGITTKQLGEAVDHDPLLQSPRLFAQHFVERLERCDAVEWSDAWHTTNLGERCLNELVELGA